MKTMRWVMAGLLGALLAGCPSDDVGAGGDVAALDTAAIDAASGDSAGALDGVAVDAVGDAGAPDAGGDAGLQDAGADAQQDAGADVAQQDTGADDALQDADAAPQDTGADDATEDTGAEDATPGDTGADAQSDTGTGPVSCFGAGDPVFPTFDKECADDDGCAVALHQVNCCGTFEALGIAKGEVAAFDAAEALCQSQYPDCGCASFPTTDEQGQTGIAFVATCDAGACTSHAASVPPMGENDVQPWLDAKSYAGWLAESAPHDSAGPHFGKVRTYVNAPLAASLAAGAQTHPIGAAAVKELYGDGATVFGWSVLLRAGAGTEGQGWYWYERWQGTVYADGLAASQCTGCHGGGTDYVLTPWPLQ